MDDVPARRGPTASSAPVVFLHIGAPKSGTSYIQALLGTNRETLASHGVLWPGPSWGVQVAAVKELRQLKSGQSLEPRGRWMKLAASIKEWGGRCAVVSMEWLINLHPHQFGAAVASLEPCRVEVVCTGRDLVRTVPASWQEAMQNGRTWSWEEFLDGVTAADPDSTVPGKAFWRMQDLPAIVRRWSRVVPLDRIHLVTVPPAGAEPRLLWTRFCELLDLDPAAFEQPQRSNESLGVASAQLMWHINQRMAQRQLSRVSYRPLLKRHLSKSVLVSRKADEGRLAFPEDRFGWMADRARRMVAELDALDLHVVGDLDDLVCQPPADPGQRPDDVPAAELLEVALDGFAGLAAHAAETGASEQDEVRQLRRTVRALERRLAAAEEQGSSG